MPRVRLSSTARAFINRETRYLRERNMAAAENFLEHLREARCNLGRFPEVGRPSPLPLPGLRRLVVGDYVLEYDLTPDAVEIIMIRHGRQQEPIIAEDPSINFEDDPDWVSER